MSELLLVILMVLGVIGATFTSGNDKHTCEMIGLVATVGLLIIQALKKNK